MPVVFVHGVPDTHRLWDPVRAALGREGFIALELPGFGSPEPAGFAATKEAYLEWLVTEIEALGEPVDLVGHDWGAKLVQRVAVVRAGLVRSWAAGGGALDPEYEWHEVAKIWQTPDAGEQFMDSLTPEALAGMADGYGLPHDYVEANIPHVDDRMKACILRLYRSAVDVSGEWGHDMERAARPALLIWGADDPFVPARFADRLAARVSGEALVLEGCGHWWPLERPAEVATALERHWSAAG